MSDNNYKATLKVAARPGSTLDEFRVYFHAFNKRRGLVVVTLSPEIMKGPAVDDPRVYAELAALNYLLMDREVLSEGRTGDGVLLTVSCRALKELRVIEALPPVAMKKLLHDAREKKYIMGTKLPLRQYINLKRHAGGFLSRYGSSALAVDGDARWIDPVVPETGIFPLDVDGPIAGSAEMTGVGKVQVSAHVFDRFRSRGNNSDQGEVWKALLGQLRDPLLQEIPFPPEVLEKKIEKYRNVGKTYLNPGSGWRFHVVAYPSHTVVVTAFYRA